MEQMVSIIHVHMNFLVDELELFGLFDPASRELGTHQHTKKTLQDIARLHRPASEVYGCFRTLHLRFSRLFSSSNNIPSFAYLLSSAVEVSRHFAKWDVKSAPSLARALLP